MLLHAFFLYFFNVWLDAVMAMMFHCFLCLRARSPLKTLDRCFGALCQLQTPKIGALFCAKFAIFYVFANLFSFYF